MFPLYSLGAWTRVYIVSKVGSHGLWGAVSALPAMPTARTSVLDKATPKLSRGSADEIVYVCVYEGFLQAS